ncbi:hypothetical protein TDB9533_03279 [Thalassocella blandensis]|nr:hypothetical protein TDB9533_03279 [Thalassocella blandensis]
MSITHSLPRVAARAFFTFACAVSVNTFAYKISYKGISPFVTDFPAAHENNTSEAWTHFCEAYPNTSPLREAPLSGLLNSNYNQCSDLVFSPSANDFVSNIEQAPLAGILLGARYPDLRELTGLDANKQDVVIVKYRDQVELDVYRIAPLSHGQLSQFHNVFGGNQQLGLEKFREYIRSSLFESSALLLSRSQEMPYDNWFVASSNMWHHDAEQNENGLWHNVPWVRILTGAAFHAIEDSYSHDPLIILDPETNRVVRGSLFYGRFNNANGHVVGVKDLLHSIHPDIEPSMGAFSHVPPILYRSQGDALNVADIPQWTEYEGQQVPMYFENNGKRYASGYAVGAISVAAVSEYISTLYFMLNNSHDPAAVDMVVEEYLDKYFSWDLYAVQGFSPSITYPATAEENALRQQLSWSNYELVDLWSQSGLDDAVLHGKKALILPWTDRNSMSDILNDPAVEQRVVIASGNEEQFDANRNIFTVKDKTLYVFHSWNDMSENNIVRVPLDDSLFYSATADGVKVQEQELNIDGGYRGLDQVYAFAWVPAGYRLCLHYPENGSGHTYGPRLAVYDTFRERYRCYYGGDEGRLVHNNFHLAATMRLSVLPIDSDGDGVPFLAGINDAIYSDACPMDAAESEDTNACADDGLEPPAPQYRLVSSVFYGGNGGQQFDDANYLAVDWQPTTFTLRSGDRIDALSTRYTNGQTIKHGGNGGSEKSLTLEAGEVVKKLEISIGKNFWGSRRVHSLRLETSKGRVLEGGTVRSERYSFVAPENAEIVGFVGRGGAEVDALGVVIREAL